MNYQQVRQQLKLHNLEVFTTQEFINIFGVSRGVASVKLTRYKQAGYLISPRRGVYYLAGEVEDKYKIANKVYTPSYISLDSALGKYDLIPETVYTLTSITTKATREFTDDQTVYRYYRIKKKPLSATTKRETLFGPIQQKLSQTIYILSPREIDN